MNQLEQIKEALEFAKRYQEKIHGQSLSLHVMAGGYQDNKLEQAISIINSMMSAKMRSAEEWERVYTQANKGHIDYALEDLIRDVRNEAFAAGLAAQGKWQPIETAPKDGSAIYVFEPPNFMGHAFWGKDDKARERWLTHITKEAKSGAWMQLVVSLDAVTHWQPLPAPPQKEGA